MAEFNSITFAKILADGTRQKIMKICSCRWLSVTEIVGQLSVTQPTVSHHLAVLRHAGLVNMREEGKQTFYRLDRKRVTLCCGQLRADFESSGDSAHS